MPRKFHRKSRFRKKKAKWRQQKLAVGTVQRIAREIAQKEDKKNLKKYVHVEYVKAAAYQWHRYAQSLPVVTNWQHSTGQALYNKLISGVGGHIQEANLTIQDASEQGQVELRVHGMQCYGVACNNSSYPVRVEARLIFIPNANTFTTSAANTYIAPRITMFHKSGQGVNGFLYRGYDKSSLAALDATGIPIKFQTLARKVIHIPARNWSATYAPAGGGPSQPINFVNPLVYRRFSLTKYFKKPRKAYCWANNPELTNGNYYFVYWSDGATTQQTYSMLATTNFQYSLKGPLNDDTAP